MHILKRIIKKITSKRRFTNEHLHGHLMNIEIHLTELVKQFSIIKTQNQKIMANEQDALNKIQELSDKVDSLQAKVDAEQADIQTLLTNNASVVSDLTAQRDALQAIIDAGGGTGDFQPVINGLQNIIAKVEQASADVEGTV